MPPSTKSHRVALLAYQQMPLFEFALAAELLRDRSAQFGKDWYDLAIVSLDKGPIRTDTGIAIEACYFEGALGKFDTLIVPGWHGGLVPATLAAAVASAHGAGTRIVSICTGAFVLAAAGLLDGRRAATHWKYADALAREYPAIRVDRNSLYIDDGDMMTSAGSAAGLDLLLHMIRADYGTATSNAVARMMVVPPHRDGGQAQYCEMPVSEGTDLALSSLFDAIGRDPAKNWTIAHMTDASRLSKRTLFRRFRAATGHAPLEWVLHRRLQAAKHLLEATTLPLDRVAWDSGFGSTDSLRHHFTRMAGVAPSAYRRTFSRN